MTGPAARPTVWLSADQQAVGDAVSAALDAAGFEVVATVEALRAGPVTGPRLGLLLHALAPDTCTQLARSVLATADVPWLVVASTPRDHGWGAALDAGAARVVDAAETSIDEVVHLLRGLADGTITADADERQDLLAAWRDHAASG